MRASVNLWIVQGNTAIEPHLFPTRGAAHIMSGIHRKRRSIKMQSTQQAMREASRPESVAGNAAPAR